jgi:hypothetical protein
MSDELSPEMKAEILRARKVDAEIKAAKMERDFKYPDYHDELIQSAKEYKDRQVTRLPERFS